MKKMNVEEMQSIEGGGFWSILSCAATLNSNGMSWADSFNLCALSEKYPVT